MAPSLAWRTASCSAAVKAAPSVTVWSAGVTTSTGSSPPSSAWSAASVIAGAVLRPTGSSTTALGLSRCSRSWSSTMKRCSSLPTTIGGFTAMSSAPSVARRSAACWNRLVLPFSTRNCLG